MALLHRGRYFPWVVDEGAQARWLRSALGTLRAIAIDRATTTHHVPGGLAVLNSDFPAAHDLNKLLITGPTEPSALAAAADHIMGQAGLQHRLIEVYDAEVGKRLARDLAPEGYEGSEDLLMAATASAQKQPPPVPVVVLDVQERAQVATTEWRRDQPGWDEDVTDQLGRRISTVLEAARVTFFAVRDNSGAVVARADLYLRDGVAQIEEVMTDPAHRGHGFASALVIHSADVARSAGASMVFLVADADDWVQHLYRRLGFTDLGHTVSLLAEPAPASNDF